MDLPYDTLCIIVSYCDINAAFALDKTCSDTRKAVRDKASDSHCVRIESILDQIHTLSSKLTWAENNMMLSKVISHLMSDTIR